MIYMLLDAIFSSPFIKFLSHPLLFPATALIADLDMLLAIASPRH